MMDVSRRLRAWLGARATTTTTSPATLPPAVALRRDPEPDLFHLARGLDDGAPCPPDLLAALAELVQSRRTENGVADGPASPRLTGLSVRRSGLPDWWAAGENLLLLGAGAEPPELQIDPARGAPRRSVVAIGRSGVFARISLGLEGALVVLGDGIGAHAGGLTCTGRSSILIGEGTTCTNSAALDCRNGGIIVTGAEGLWAHSVSLMSDDGYAIRDAATGQRLNGFGGRIVVDRHVWLCEQVRLLGGARVGADAVVGAGALVKHRVVPPNAVVVGAPARPVRSGVTWSREDEP